MTLYKFKTSPPYNKKPGKELMNMFNNMKIGELRKEEKHELQNEHIYIFKLTDDTYLVNNDMLKMWFSNTLATEEEKKLLLRRIKFDKL